MTEEYCPHIGNQPYVHGHCPWCDNKEPKGIIVQVVVQHQNDNLEHKFSIDVPKHFSTKPELREAYCFGVIAKRREDLLAESKDIASACEQYSVMWEMLGKNDNLLHKNNRCHRQLRAYLEGFGTLEGRK